MNFRAAALAACILILFPAAASAATWEGERSQTDAAAFASSESLAVLPGTNITFDIPPAGANGSRPVIDISGRLDVGGTASSLVVFRAQSSVFSRYRAPAALQLRGCAFSVRNASFVEMEVRLDGARGLFEDCRFVDCDVIVKDSPAVFQNCTFEWASNLDIIGPAGGPEVLVSGCRFNGSQGWRICEWRWDTYVSAVEANGPVLLRDTNITDYGYGLRQGPGRVRLEWCNVSYCYLGLDIGPAGQTDILGATIENCLYAGVRSRGIIAMRGSTVWGCEYGVVLDGPPGSAPAPLLRGNRIAGNGAFGIAFADSEFSPGDTLFDFDGLQNGAGRMLRFVRLNLSVVDQHQNGVRSYSLNVTDRFGNGENRSWTAGAANLTLADHFIDNGGNRVELFPYTITAWRKGLSNRTVVPTAVESVTLVVPALADLVPLRLTTDPARPGSGRRATCTLVIENRGAAASAPATARLLCQGQPAIEAGIPAIAPGARASVDFQLRVPREGRTDLNAVVDVNENVAESDERNNALAAALEAGPAPHPLSTGQAVGAFLVLVVSAGAALAARRRG